MENKWDIFDNDGLTIAHAAAKSGRLPQDCDWRELIDVRGETVAHVAAESGSLSV
jgi:hypothetical protein